MRYVVAAVGAVLLAGCASFSGVGGQYSTTETVEVARRPANFYDGVVTVGQQLGYQHTGGNRSANTVNLGDQPNFGETLIGRSYGTRVMVTLQPDGRTIEIMYTAVGGSTTAGAARSQQRIEQLKAALQQQFGD
jgi:hypothetical protein